MGHIIELKRWRGTYVARLDGPDPQYGLARERVEPVLLKRLLRYEITEPGFYIWRQGLPPKAENVFGAFDGVTMRELEGHEIGSIATASTGPNPGEDGSFYGNRCLCGELLGDDNYRCTPDGWPRCISCYDAENVPAATGPELVPVVAA